ncbi:MAG: hypothetical protein U0X91_21420 [Spirosomataceae bacterium]
MKKVFSIIGFSIMMEAMTGCNRQTAEISPEINKESKSAARIAVTPKINKYFFNDKEYSEQAFNSDPTIKGILEDDKHCLYVNVEDTERITTLYRTFSEYLTKTGDVSFATKPSSVSEEQAVKKTSDFIGSFSVGVSLYDGFNFNYLQASAIGYEYMTNSYQPGSFQSILKSSSDFSQSINNFSSFGTPSVSTFNDVTTSYSITIGSNFMPWQAYWKRPKVKVYMFKNNNFGGASLVKDIRCPFANGTSQINTDDNSQLGSLWNNKISSVKVLLQ